MKTTGSFVWDGQYRTASVSRPDVGAAYPAWGSAHGFDQTVTVAANATAVRVDAINAPGNGGGNPFLGEKAI